MHLPAGGGSRGQPWAVTGQASMPYLVDLHRRTCERASGEELTPKAGPELEFVCDFLVLYGVTTEYLYMYF